VLEHTPAGAMGWCSTASPRRAWRTPRQRWRSFRRRTSSCASAGRWRQSRWSRSATSATPPRRAPTWSARSARSTRTGRTARCGAWAYMRATRAGRPGSSTASSSRAHGSCRTRIPTIRSVPATCGQWRYAGRAAATGCWRRGRRTARPRIQDRRARDRSRPARVEALRGLLAGPARDQPAQVLELEQHPDAGEDLEVRRVGCAAADGPFGE
jgi:hypothetical protein